MPRGGARIAGPGKRLGRPPKAMSGITQDDLLTLLRAPKSFDKLFHLRLKKFGLTNEQYQDMIQQQQGRCALCNEPLSAGWVIDHDHLRMTVRGLLHSRCNSLLGFANEDPKRLEQAIAYLKKHNKYLA